MAPGNPDEFQNMFQLLHAGGITPALGKHQGLGAGQAQLHKGP